MSTARMCDVQRSPGCVQIFSEDAEGWTSFTGGRRRKDPQSGRTVVDTVAQDACPVCTAASFQPQTPPTPPVPITRAEHYDPVKTRALEDDLGIPHAE